MDNLSALLGSIPASTAACCGMCLASSRAPCVFVRGVPALVFQ